jgi:hypothetical protein
MDDLNVNNEKNLHKEIKTHKYSLLRNFLSSKTTTDSITKPSSSPNVTCLSILKQIFRQPSKRDSRNIDFQTNILTY